MLRSMRQKSASLFFCAIAVLGPAGNSAAESVLPPAAIQFEIPGRSVADALILFAEQSGEQIIFRYDEASNIPARELSGSFKPVEALMAILKDTGLKAYRNTEGTIVIRRDADHNALKLPEKTFSPAKEDKLIIRTGEGSPQDRTPEELVITGSRIKRAELSAPNLVSIISAETVERTGTVNIEELLNKLPQIVPSLTGNSNNPGEGIATVDLRGLGPDRTLVLVNGRRITPGNQSGIVDLNSIPTFLLEKIEVATGGTSAVYGADALAGVVNFKLRDDFDGFEGLARYRLSKDGDGDKYDLNIVYGQEFNDERGHAFLHLGFLERQSIYMDDRNFSTFTLADSFIRPGSSDPIFGFGEFLAPEEGGVPGLIRSGSSVIPGGNVLGVSASGPHPGLQRFDKDGEPQDFNSLTDRYNYAPFNFLQLPQKRLMATFGARYHLTDRVEFFNQVIFSQNKVDLELAPSPLVISDLEISVDNPFLQENARAALQGIDWYATGQIWQARDGGGNLLFDDQGNPVQARQAVDSLNGNVPIWAADGTPVAAVGGAGRLLYLADGRAELPYLLRRMTELGPRKIKNNRRSLNVVLGLQGEIKQNWDFYAHYNYSQYNNTVRSINAVSTSKFRSAVDIISSGGDYICADQAARQEGCVPANIFGEDNLSQAAIDYITTNYEDKTRYIRQDATAYIKGTIDHGVGNGLKILLGADWRREDGSAAGQTGDFSDLGGGFNRPVDANGSYNLWSLFSEIRIPLIEDVTGFEEFELSGAMRYSDYNLSGTVWSAAAGFNWRPFSDVRIRGQYQRAVREPNIKDIFAAERETFLFITDPCAAGNIDSYGDIAAICIATGVPENLVGGYDQLSGQMREIYSGNPDLELEKSDTFTVGLIYQPSFLPEIQLTVDYYHITINNRISPLSDSASEIVDGCYDQNASQALFCDRIARRPDGQLAHINSSLSNLGRSVTSGIDGQLFYRKRLNNGLFGGNERLELVFQSSYLIKHDHRQTIVERTVDCAGYFLEGCKVPLPKFRFTQMVTWGNDRLDISLRWRHIGGITNKKAKTEDVAVARLPAKNYFDIYLQYGVTENIIMRTGVDNIFNSIPDFVGTGQQQANTFPNIYDVLGPFFHFGVNFYY